MPVDRNEHVEFFAQLYEALTSAPKDEVFVREVLVESGVDVDATLGKGMGLFADFKKRRRLQLSRERLERLREAVNRWSGVGEGTLGAIKEQIARALAGDQGQLVYQTYYRKLERVEVADLESLREDAALLEFVVRVEADGSE